MGPFEKYDMTFNGATPSRLATRWPSKYAGQENGWVMAPITKVVMDFNNR
jgi:hypothetical protein